MRLITTDLITAFPQLDPFPVEQRKKFLDRAIHPSLRSFAQVTIGVIALIACAVTFVLQPIDAAIGPGQFPTVFGVRIDPLYLLALLSIIVAALTTALGYFIRDRIIVQRLKEIFSKRGSCHACKHTLLGLPVPDDYRVTCPECGTITEVDPSLCELQSAANPALASITPRPTRVVTQAGDVHIPIWKQRTIRLIFRGICLTLITIITVAAILFVIDEIAIRQVASFAKSTQRNYATLTSGPSAPNSPATPASEAAWAELMAHFHSMPTAPALEGWVSHSPPHRSILGSEVTGLRLFYQGSLYTFGSINLRTPLDPTLQTHAADSQWHHRLHQLIDALPEQARIALPLDDSNLRTSIMSRASSISFVHRSCMFAANNALKARDRTSFELYAQSTIRLNSLRASQPSEIGYFLRGYDSIQSLPSLLLSALEQDPSAEMLVIVQRLSAALPAETAFTHKLTDDLFWSTWESTIQSFSDTSTLRFHAGPVSQFLRSKLSTRPSSRISLEYLKRMYVAESEAMNNLPQIATLSPSQRTPPSLAAPIARMILDELDDYTRSLILLHVTLAHRSHFEATGTISDDLKILSAQSSRPQLILAAADWGTTVSFKPLTTITPLNPQNPFEVSPNKTPLKPDFLPPLLNGHQQLFIHHASGSIPLTPTGPAASPTP